MTSSQDVSGRLAFDYILEIRHLLFFFLFILFLVRRSFASRRSRDNDEETGKERERKSDGLERRGRREEGEEGDGYKDRGGRSCDAAANGRERERKMRQKTSVYSVASLRPIELRSENEKNERTSGTNRLSLCLRRGNRTDPLANTRVPLPAATA